jgi:hypothetical protein
LLGVGHAQGQAIAAGRRDRRLRGVPVADAEGEWGHSPFSREKKENVPIFLFVTGMVPRRGLEPPRSYPH